MKKLSKKEIRELFSKIEINLETGEVPLLDNFRTYKEEREWVKPNLLDFLDFIVLHQEFYRIFYKYGQISFGAYIDQANPVKDVTDEEKELPVIDAKEVIARSVRRFAEWLSEAYDENSAFTLDEILAEIGVFIETLDDTTGEEDDHED